MKKELETRYSGAKTWLRLTICIPIACWAATSIWAQGRTEDLAAGRSLERQQALQVVRNAIDRGFPPNLREQLRQVTDKHRAAVVPELLAAIDRERKRQSPGDEALDGMSDLVAYAGDEKAFIGLVALAADDLARFGPAVARCLDYAAERENAFMLAYHALGKGTEQTDSLIGEWAARAARREGGMQLLAEAVVRWHPAVEFGTQVAADPMLAALDKAELKQLEAQTSEIRRQSVETPR